MINGLQLVAHIPLFTLTLPANAMVLFNELATLVSFDYFESAMERMDLGMTETEAYNVRFDWLGYNSHNTIENLSSIMVALILILIKLMIALAVSVFRCRCQKKLKHYIRRRRNRRRRNMCLECCLDAQISLWVLHQTNINIVLRFLLETLLEIQP